MAEVWEAVDQVLDRPVAIKVLHPHLAGDQTFVERFRREAIAAARLTHPSIVAIYDTHSSDGDEAIVMELVRGVSLRKHLDDNGALPAGRGRRTSGPGWPRRWRPRTGPAWSTGTSSRPTSCSARTSG